MTTRCGRLQSLALAIFLAIGAGTAWALLAAWGYGIVGVLLPSMGAISENVLILRDGTPIIQSWVDYDYEHRTFRTLDGKRLNLVNPKTVSPAYLLWPGHRTRPFTHLSWSERIGKDYSRSVEFTAWYFLHDGNLHGHGYLVGYDTKLNYRIGYIGRKGFRPDEPPPEEQFPVAVDKMRRFGSTFFPCNSGNGDSETVESSDPDALYSYCLLADDGLMRINLKERTVIVMRKDTTLVSATAASKPKTLTNAPSANSSQQAIILARTPDRILVLDLNGKELAAYPLPPEICKVNLHCFQLPANKALVLGYGVHRSDELLWFDAAGKLGRRELVNLQKPPPIAKYLDDVKFSLTFPSPGAIIGFYACYLWNTGNRPESLEYGVALSKAITDARLILLITGAISVVLACVCYRRHRKYGLPWTWVWTVLVLLFGVPAFLGYLAHRIWPARLPCPNCQRPVPRDRPACFACGREFPAPALKGIEVFA